MTTLYELRELRDLLDEKLTETAGELTPELEAEMAALDLSTDEKIERVALYIREQLATAEAIETEAKRLQARSAASASRIGVRSNQTEWAWIKHSTESNV